MPMESESYQEIFYNVGFKCGEKWAIFRFVETDNRNEGEGDGEFVLQR